MLLVLLWWHHRRQRVEFEIRKEITPAELFSREQITQTFISSLPSLTRELKLEVATAKQTELIEVSENKTWLGLNIGTNTAQVQLPHPFF